MSPMEVLLWQRMDLHYQVNVLIQSNIYIQFIFNLKKLRWIGWSCAIDFLFLACMHSPSCVVSRQIGRKFMDSFFLYMADFHCVVYKVQWGFRYPELQFTDDFILEQIFFYNLFCFIYLEFCVPNPDSLFYHKTLQILLHLIGR